MLIDRVGTSRATIVRSDAADRGGASRYAVRGKISLSLRIRTGRPYEIGNAAPQSTQVRLPPASLRPPRRQSGQRRCLLNELNMRQLAGAAPRASSRT